MLPVVLLLIACGSEPAAVEAPPAPATPEAAPAPVAAPAPAAAATEIDIAGFHAKHTAGEVPLLVDVRTDDEWNSGHVPGAIHIPMQEIQGRLSELDAHKDGPIYFICASGGRSGRVSAQLRNEGYQAVNVMGGTSGWKAAGYPVE